MSKISIVTISYNQADFLQRCIESVLSQDYGDIEYIVVDPGSSDRSREIIDSYLPRLTRVYERDSGPPNGLNNGFRRATGEILFFLNADDTILPGALSFVAGFFSQNRDVDVINCGGYVIDENDRKTKKVFPSAFGKYLYLYGATNLLQQGVFFRRSAFDEVGGFNEKNRVCWDGELFYDFLSKGFRFFAINKNLGCFRIYNGTITGSGGYMQKLDREHARIFESALNRPRKWYDSQFGNILWLVKQITVVYIVLRSKILRLS